MSDVVISTGSTTERQARPPTTGLDHRVTRHPRRGGHRTAAGPGGGADGGRPAARRADPCARRSATRSDEVAEALAELADDYTRQGRGFELRNVAGGWRFYTREEYAAVVEGFILDGQQARLTQAALETLAVVAYKQPVSGNGCPPSAESTSTA